MSLQQDSYVSYDDGGIRESMVDDDSILYDTELRKSMHELPILTEDAAFVTRQFTEYADPSRRVVDDVKYTTDMVYPGWLTNNKSWLEAGMSSHNEISEILEKPKNERTEAQWRTLVAWVMSVWPIANELGPKRCMAMTKAFHFFHYEPGTDIITEGERGLVFYIIIDGIANVIKDGVGVVASLGKGKSFGEIALTQGKDLRTATVRAVDRVQTLSLHKSDYDMFVKDIQQVERRENFYHFKRCVLFSKWTRAKLERMANTASRKNFPAETIIFNQGDAPDNAYIVLEGEVQIVKEVVIISRNRWPTGMESWEGAARRTVKKINVDRVGKSGYFGELSILKGCGRHATAKAITPVTLLALGKLEFLHLLGKDSEREQMPEEAFSYKSDEQLLELFNGIAGGPTSTIETYGTKVSTKDLDNKEKKNREERRLTSLGAFGKKNELSAADKSKEKSQQDISPSTDLFFDKMKSQFTRDAEIVQAGGDPRKPALDFDKMKADALAAEREVEANKIGNFTRPISDVSKLSAHGTTVPKKTVLRLKTILRNLHPETYEGHAHSDPHHLPSLRESRKMAQQTLSDDHPPHLHHEAQKMFIIPKSHKRLARQKTSGSMSRFEAHVHDSKHFLSKVKDRREISKSEGVHDDRHKQLFNTSESKSLKLATAMHLLKNVPASNLYPVDRRQRQEAESEVNNVILEEMQHARDMKVQKELEDEMRLIAEAEAATEVEAEAAMREEMRAKKEEEENANENKQRIKLHKQSSSIVQIEYGASNEEMEELEDLIEHDKIAKLEHELIATLSTEELVAMYQSAPLVHSHKEHSMSELDFNPEDYFGGHSQESDKIGVNDLQYMEEGRLHQLQRIKDKHAHRNDVDLPDVVGIGEGALEDTNSMGLERASQPSQWVAMGGVYKNRTKKSKPNKSILSKAILTYKDVLG